MLCMALHLGIQAFDPTNRWGEVMCGESFSFQIQTWFSGSTAEKSTLSYHRLLAQTGVVIMLLKQAYGLGRSVDVILL